MSKTAKKPNYDRAYEKELMRRGVKIWPRNIEIPDGCWLCGETNAKLTKARYFPNWMLQALGCANEKYVTAHYDPIGNEISRQEIPYNKLVCEQVCQNCIHGWMDELYSDFKPLFLGDTNKALQEQPLLVARWAAKTATLINISQQRRLQVPVEARHGLSDKTSMPKGWRVYAFTCSSEGTSPIMWTQGAPVLAMFGGSPEQQDQITLGNVFACTLKFSNFGLQVYWQPDNVYYLEPANPYKRLWPNPEPVTLSDFDWHPYMGMFVADIQNDKATWQAYLDNARLKASRPDIDLYDFNQ